MSRGTSSPNLAPPRLPFPACLPPVTCRIKNTARPSHPPEAAVWPLSTPRVFCKGIEIPRTPAGLCESKQQTLTMKRIARPFLLISFSLVLSACTITDMVEPFEGDYSYTFVMTDNQEG